MAKAVQFYNTNTSLFDQYDITEADVTLGGVVVANRFFSTKDANDNLYLFCGSTLGGSSYYAKIFKIEKNGNKTYCELQYSSSQYVGATENERIGFYLQRNGKVWVYSWKQTNTYHLWELPNFSNGQAITLQNSIIPAGTIQLFAVYQDRYIWVASGTTVKIYDYGSKAELASVSVVGTDQYSCMAVNSNNELYIACKNSANAYHRLYKIVFNGASTLTANVLYEETTAPFNSAKQLLIDKLGDLIILTNSGTASTLLKYTTAGVQIGTALNLANPSYNLNTDSQGNYYYSNALATYKIAANTAQGQNFTGTGTKILDSGMTTYGNDTTGYLVSANGSVGC